MKINKYLPFAYIYFLINSLGLPLGLTYTAFLSPLFYWWVTCIRRKEILHVFLVCLIPFFIAHAILGVNVKAYIISVINYTGVYIFCQAFYTFLKNCGNTDIIFRKILITNFILCLLAIPLYFTPYSSFVWMNQTISAGLSDVKRLSLFTYEASYYATLFTPLFLYYLTRLVLKQNNINSWLLLCLILLPLLLSFSLGVLICLAISCLTVLCIHFSRLIIRKRVQTLLLLSLSLTLTLLVLLWIFFPQNGIFLRIENIATGKDTSGNGRTFEAFILATKMLELKNGFWGIGAGQIKILGADIVRSFYLYDLDYNTIAIPNAAAETLAIFGWIGLSFRLSLEIFLFFHTKVWTNYYRLSLFVFIFIYQFTGSFITNIAEYVIWILAFTEVFPMFTTNENSKLLQQET